MYIERVPNRNSPPAILLREGWREGKKTRKRTIANLSHWPAHKIEALRRLLKDETLVSPDEVFTIERDWPHGHVAAVLEAMRRLGMAELIASQRSRSRDLVLALIAERLLHPCSKLATTRLWHNTTLASELSVEDADEDDLYSAMDWLLARQRRIEKKLASRHLDTDCYVLYDVSSSYYEGRHCELAQFGHNRDGKRGKQIIVYGVLTDASGRPISVSVYPGNTGDPSTSAPAEQETVADQAATLKSRFELERVVLVGDRGMLTQARIEALHEHPGIGWISALRSHQVRTLVEQDALQLSLFDTQNLAEIRSPEFPGERLIACYNPLLADERVRKRNELLDATEQALEKIKNEVERRTKTPLTEGAIGKKVGARIGRFKMAKHFELDIADGHFRYQRNQASIDREAALDGIYVIRTSEPERALSAEDVVRRYKSLAQVERVFRTFKGSDLRIRPIHHRTNDRVRAHIFLCLLAYYVEWHLRQAWAPLLFDDEDLPADRSQRDPVAPAQPSTSAKHKKRARVTDEGWPVHSFNTLMADLATRCRHRCRLGIDPEAPAIYQDTQPTPLQARAMELLKTFPVKPK